MTIDSLPTDKAHSEEAVTFTCTECDKFKATKRYSGAKGTKGKDEYDKISFNECPYCGAKIEKISRE